MRKTHDPSLTSSPSPESSNLKGNIVRLLAVFVRRLPAGRQGPQITKLIKILRTVPYPALIPQMLHKKSVDWFKS